MLYKRYVKGIFDWCAAFAFIIILSWLFLIIFFVYVILWEFPIFFTQKRIGKNNSSFRMCKFRTLLVNEELSVHDRGFWWGRFLRFTSLDELPQLWNIIKREMAFIGPRPLPEEYLPLYSKVQIRRHEVKPGITGLAQVSGRNSISWKKKFELDLYYVENISLKLDLMIWVKTFALLFSFKKDVSLAEEKFKGN